MDRTPEVITWEAPVPGTGTSAINLDAILSEVGVTNPALAYAQPEQDLDDQELLDPMILAGLVTPV